MSKKEQVGASPVDNFIEIVDYAIEREEEEALFYLELAQRVESADVRAMMLRHADEERQHRERLLEMRATHALPLAEGGLPGPDLKIADYLVPNPGQGSTLGYQDALILAIKREQANANLYEDLARFAEDRETRQVFRFLCEQERKHKEALEKEYDDNILEED